MQYHVLNAFSELCKQYSIAVAVRSFSALKRVKSCTSPIYTMMQELKASYVLSLQRLEGLMLMTVEKKLLMCLSNKAIVQQSSSELSRALL